MLDVVALRSAAESGSLACSSIRKHRPMKVKPDSDRTRRRTLCVHRPQNAGCSYGHQQQPCIDVCPKDLLSVLTLTERRTERSAVPASSAHFSGHLIAGAAWLRSGTRHALLIDLRRWLGPEEDATMRKTVFSLTRCKIGVVLSVQRFLALLPVAGAEFVGLKCVQNSQNFVNVAANAQIMDRQPAK